MASITVTVPDEHISRSLDAVALLLGYNGAGGETKAQFARRMVAQTVKDWIVRGEMQAAAAVAQADAATVTVT